jgi:hypothetical protein
MAALGDDWGGDWRRLLTLGGGIAILLAGLLALTVGGARVVTSLLVGMGLPTAAAREIAIASVSTIPPVILGGMVVLTKPRGTSRLVGLAGVAIALTGIAVGLPLGFEAALPLVALLYATGVFFVLAVLVHGLVSEKGEAGTDATSGWSREVSAGSTGTRGAMPADGGDEDDDLTFLLDDEDER